MSIAEKISKWAFPCEHRLKQILAEHQKEYLETIQTIQEEGKGAASNIVKTPTRYTQ